MNYMNCSKRNKKSNANNNLKKNIVSALLVRKSKSSVLGQEDILLHWSPVIVLLHS